LNTAPTVQAGADQTVVLPGLAYLAGQVADDGLPIPPGQLSAEWSTVAGPGAVTFAPSGLGRATAAFSVPGVYSLRLTATDGALATQDALVVEVVGDTYEDWRRQHFSAVELLNPAISGMEADPDNDRHTNRQEYVAGTDPRDTASVLQIVGAEVLAAPAGEVRLRIPVVTGRTYTLQVCRDLPDGVWEDRLRLPAATADAVITVADSDPSDPGLRLYRVVTP
jgi:hypothetical protein